MFTKTLNYQKSDNDCNENSYLHQKNHNRRLMCFLLEPILKKYFVKYDLQCWVRLGAMGQEIPTIYGISMRNPWESYMGRPGSVRK